MSDKLYRMHGDGGDNEFSSVKDAAGSTVSTGSKHVASYYKRRAKKHSQKAAELAKESQRPTEHRTSKSTEHRPSKSADTNTSQIKRSPRQNKPVGQTNRSSASYVQPRRTVGTERISSSSNVHTLKRSSAIKNIQKQRTVSNLIAKKKARESAAEAFASSIKQGLAAWAEGSSFSGAVAAGKFFLIAVLIIQLVIIVGCIAVIVVFTMMKKNSLKGDWYNSQSYKTNNFVEVTQDLQRKYYDDCLMLAYRYGADTPTYNDIKIDWSEVYSLWCVIVRYRSGNEKMSKVYSGNKTGYSVGGAVFDKKGLNSALFSANDEYLQDFYLAFYAMYYDMNALDTNGNPIVVDSMTGQRYVPYYPNSVNGTGLDYSYFSEEHGYPLTPDGGKTVVTNIIALNNNYQWYMTTPAYQGRYYFPWCTIRSDGETVGCINRGLPKVSISSLTKVDTYPSGDQTNIDTKITYPKPTAIEGLDILHSAYKKVYLDSWYNSYHTGNFSLASYRKITGQRVIESETLGNGCDGILVILDELFDRSVYMPWGANSMRRWASNSPNGLYAYGLPEASGGGHDCYNAIRSNLNGVRSNALSHTVEGIRIPFATQLHAAFDTASDSKVSGYKSIYDNMVKSIKNAQNAFPFKVNKDPYGNGTWKSGLITDSDADAYDVLSNSTYKQSVTWNSTTYLMYRYLTCSQGLSPAAACGVLGALQLECGFSTSGYKSITRDNNDCYALGLLQWNDGTQYKADKSNLYSHELCKWSRENNYYWKNAGTQLKFLDACFDRKITNSGNYSKGIKACQNVGQGTYPDIGESSYTNAYGMPTYTLLDNVSAYEACYYWGVHIEKSVEAIGGSYYGRSCPRYSLSASGIFTDNRAHPDMTKQRMVAGHIFLRYISASDPDYYSVDYYTEEL